MADELVYRLVLDGQEDKPGSGQGTAQRSTSTGRDTDFDPLAAARQRIRREDEAQMADQAYRAIKQGKSLGQIEDEDHQAKLDAWEEEQAAQRERTRKEQERREDEANRRRIRDEERQERDEDWLARDQMRQAKEEEARKEREALEQARLQREANLTDPTWLANQALQRQQLAEQTRLQMEATKAGVSPEEIRQREEQAELKKQRQDQIKSGADYAGGAAANLLRPSALGLAKQAMSLNPVGAAIGQALGQVTDAIKQNAAEFRGVTQRLTAFSPDIAKARAEANVRDITFMAQLAKEQGGQRAALEKERRDIQRELMKYGTFSEKTGLLMSKLDLAIGKLLDWLVGEFGGEKGRKEWDKAIPGFFPPNKDQEAPKPAVAPNLIMKRPDFRAQRVAPLQPKLKIPFQEARGMNNPALPGV